MAERHDQPDSSQAAAAAQAAAAPAARQPLVMRVLSDPAQVAPVRKAVEALCLDCGLGPEAAADVGLSVNEAMANVIRHAYGGATDRPVAVSGECECDAAANRPVVRITIRDWGGRPAGNGGNSGADPLAPRYVPGIPGGLGLVCIRGLMDEVTYTPQPDGMLLTMVKRKQ